MSKLIDVQSHYMPPEVAQKTAFFKVHWSDINKQLQVMDTLGIEQALWLYPTSDAHVNMGGWANVCDVYNRGIADAVKKHPDRFIGAGIISPDNEKALQKELKQIENFGLRALSLASSYDGKYLDDPYFDGVFEFAQRKRIPIHVHPQIINPIGEERVRDPLLTPVLEYVMDVSMCLGKMMMNERFRKFPDVKIIFAHYGGVLPIVKERFDNTYLMLRGRNFVKDIQKIPGEYFKNLYFDTSGSKSPASLLCALEVAPASQILFASDYPANQDIAQSIDIIKKAPISASEKDGILGKNFLNIFKA